MPKRVIGVIGGSGVYELDGLEDRQERRVQTPFGAPSDAYLTGRLGDTEMVFLARHGRGHRLLPHEINYRANVYGMKTLGADWIISLSAVGSMREHIRPGDMVIVDQYFDRTHGRASTFFGDGIVAHVAFSDPVSPVLADVLYEAASEISAASRDDDDGGFAVHRGGTYLVINGPQFSTRAESNIYRQWGVDVIGMTNMPEAKLAREAEISYATVALATDYDCWHEDEEDVSVGAVLAVLRKNAARARQLVARAAARIPAEHTCAAATALDGAMMIDPDHITDEVKRRLGPIIGKYL